MRPLVRVTLSDGQATALPLKPPSAKAEFHKYDAEHSLALFQEVNFTGTFLWSLDPKSNQSRASRAQRALGERRAGRGRGSSSIAASTVQELKGAVLLPPDYRPGRKYPVLTWVYAGSMVREAHRMTPLNSTRARSIQPALVRRVGYVVLVPSMPLRPDGQKNDDYIELPKEGDARARSTHRAGHRRSESAGGDGAELRRLRWLFAGHVHQSLQGGDCHGGVDRSGPAYGEFDHTARGYPGIAHPEVGGLGAVGAGPGQHGRAAVGWMSSFWRNSPISSYVDRVETPLLMIHGEQDIRGPMTQAEEFFFGLYRQGKRAKLLRYWGETTGCGSLPPTCATCSNRSSRG